jgi:hypothetical protein
MMLRKAVSTHDFSRGPVSKRENTNRFIGFVQETDKSVQRTRALFQAHD